MFRAKYLLMLQLKFNPFVKHIDFLYWKHGGAKFDFYERPSKDCYEHAIVQLYYEGTTNEILTKYLEVINVTEMNQKLFNQVASAREIKIIDLGCTFADFSSPQLKK